MLLSLDYLSLQQLWYYFPNCVFFILTHPASLPCGRKPERPEKTHDFNSAERWQTIFTHESVARIEPIDLRGEALLWRLHQMTALWNDCDKKWPNATWFKVTGWIRIFLPSGFNCSSDFRTFAQILTVCCPFGERVPLWVQSASFQCCKMF
jgi:hypothetical protein